MAKKVIDIENRIPQLARRKKRRRMLQYSFIGVIVLLLIVIVIYHQSPYSKIQTIHIDGADYKDEAYYKEQLPLQIGNSMWFNVGDMEQAITNNDWIKHAHIERDWLTTVSITIEEYAHVGYVQQENEYYAVLENGDIVSESLATSVIDAPLLSGFNDDAYFSEMLKQLAQLKPEVLTLISQVLYTPSQSDKSVVTLYMTDGYEVRVLIHEFATKINYYPAIVVQLSDIEAKGIIDLEVGSYFTSFDAEYGIRIQEETYIEELDEQLENDEESPESEEEAPANDDDTEAADTSVGAA